METKTLNPFTDDLFESIANICKEYNEKHILNQPKKEIKLKAEVTNGRLYLPESVFKTKRQ